MLTCLQEAAHQFGVSDARLERIYQPDRKQQTGMGAMDIADGWAPILKKAGFSLSAVKTDTCENIRAAAWILSASRHKVAAGMVANGAARPTQACLDDAARTYHVQPHALLMAFQNGERFAPRHIGPMGIPSGWLPILREAGFPEWQVKHNVCWNIAAGAWIMAASYRGAGTGDVWQATSGYLPSPPARYGQLITHYANLDHVPAALIAAVITQESGFNANAVSSMGAEGLMQLMPATAARFGVSNPFNPAQAIRGGTAYLAHLLHEFNGSKRLAIAGYNAGGQAVINAGYHIPPYQETEHYVPAVLGYYQKISDGDMR
ncbi:lytic transglycosylase catalytic subunit [Acidithiobacillus sp. GGI-221]|nr:lytic transglycosylase catalytic subunit [Acidithiobacillus sp. GGI-221]